MIPYFDQVKTYILKNNLYFLVQIFFFAVIIYFFHWLWWTVGLEKWLSHYAFFHETELWLAHQVFVPAAWIVKHILGYSVQTANDTLYFSNHGYVAVEGSCSGLKQFYQWFFLMLLFPGLWKRKLWYIPLGILAVHLYNIFRIVVLSVVVVHWPEHWNFIHLEIMRPLYYGVMFVMWVIWVEKVSPPKFKRAKKNQ